MDAKSILDSLVTSGRQFSDKAVDFAESNLGLPKAGQDRDAMQLDQGLADQIELQLHG